MSVFFTHSVILYLSEAGHAVKGFSDLNINVLQLFLPF